MVSGTSAPALDAAPSARAVAGIWARHLTSFYFPALTLLFLATAPHAWYEAVLFIWPLALAHQLDCGPRIERRQPEAGLPAWPFDAIVYALAALQIGIVAWTVVVFSRQPIFSVDMVMAFLLIGASSGFSIITAHELIHRKRRGEQWLGRLLLCSVLYEHFYTEHLRGHHARVGTPEDPATARFGEAYEPFFRRTVPAQLRSAWRLEAKRLGDPDMGLFDARQLRNRVLHGLVIEWGVALAVLLVFGLASLVAFLLQALMAVRLLEAVNYFEHWGLVRSGRRVRPVDSWDTHSWFTYYGLVGLSRHADHHAWPARPYQQLRVFDEAPLLPIGYVGLVDLVMAKNREFQEIAAKELGRRRLGPFAGEAEPVAPRASRACLLDAQRAERRPPRGWRRALGRRLAALPAAARALLLLGLVAGVATLGVQWEAAGAGIAGMGGLARFALHGWILGVLAAGVIVARRVREHWDHESFAFGVGFALIAALGVATDALLTTL